MTKHWLVFIGTIAVAGCSAGGEATSGSGIAPLNRLLELNHVSAPAGYLMIHERGYWEAANFDLCRIAKGQLAPAELTSIKEMMQAPIPESFTSKTPCTSGYELRRQGSYTCWEAEDHDKPLADLAALFDAKFKQTDGPKREDCGIHQPPPSPNLTGVNAAGSDAPTPQM